MAEQEQKPRIGTWNAAGGDTPAGDEPEYGVVGYYGTDIRVVLDPISLELAFEEFMDVASGLEGVDDPRSFAVVRQFLRLMIHPDDFNTFWRLVRTNRQDTTRQMEFGKWLMEELSGHPIVQQSGSAPGLLGTLPNSGDDASSRVQERLEAQGRPDLALVVVNHREAQEARSTV